MLEKEEEEEKGGSQEVMESNEYGEMMWFMRKSLRET